MSILEIIKNRHSIRKYSEKPVEEQKIIELMTAVQHAPSWRNRQCWRLIIIKDPSIRAQVIRCTGAYNQAWLSTAPIIIVACGDPELSGFRNDQYYYLVDVAIALEHLVLTAVDLGLGTCWIGAYDESKIKKNLAIPENIRIVALTPLGYPAKNEGLFGKIVKRVTKSKKRKSIEKIFFYDQWKET